MTSALSTCTMNNCIREAAMYAIILAHNDGLITSFEHTTQDFKDQAVGSGALSLESLRTLTKKLQSSTDELVYMRAERLPIERISQCVMDELLLIIASDLATFIRAIKYYAPDLANVHVTVSDGVTCLLLEVMEKLSEISIATLKMSATAQARRTVFSES